MLAQKRARYHLNSVVRMVHQLTVTRLHVVTMPFRAALGWRKT
jgi:hypothetical protein